MKIIICITDGAEIMVDDEDHHWLSRFPWYRGGIAQHPMTFLYGKNGKGRPVYMHQLIMGGAVNTDHHDQNVLNMQKDNLRVATHAQNEWNKAKQKTSKGKPCTSQYKGVSLVKGRWRAQIKRHGVHYPLGEFSNEVDAARAYNKKAEELSGNFVWLNPLPEINHQA